MRLTLLCVALVSLLCAPLAFAGSPHFVSCAQSVTGNTLTVDGKEAGLGDEEQIHVVVTATASCINPGDHHPQAANKETVTAEEDVPVQNGRALFSIDVTATFQPSCSPPMSVVFSDVTACDTTNNICCTL